jgi:5-methylcytosine-specific restriction endonuclease McrA
MKFCKKCGRDLPTTSFTRDKSRTDGLYPLCKECHNARRSELYKQNRSVVRAQQKAKYWANPEKARAEKRTSVARLAVCNPEYISRVKAYMAKYYQRNKAKWYMYGESRDLHRMRQQKAIYRKTHKTQVAATLRAWHLRNKAKVSANRHKRVVRSKSVERTLTETQLKEILEYFDYKCAYCLVDLRTLPQVEQTIDHLLPISKNGAHSADNVVPCCKSCNSRKGGRSIILMARYVER